jgi:hypothetical protein
MPDVKIILAQCLSVQPLDGYVLSNQEEIMFKEFLSFRRMVTPVLVQIIFWLAVLACIALGIANILNSLVLQGILTILIGPLIVRIICEYIIVLFRINNTLMDIKDQGKP